jgi:hypothetical protein
MRLELPDPRIARSFRATIRAASVASHLSSIPNPPGHRCGCRSQCHARASGSGRDGVSIDGFDGETAIVPSPFNITSTRFPNAIQVPVIIVTTRGNSGSVTAMGTPSAATPRTCRAAVPRVRWRKPTRARQRPTVPAPTGQLVRVLPSGDGRVRTRASGWMLDRLHSCSHPARALAVPSG